MLPSFLVIGAMKAGTTSLHRYLREHPQIFMPQEKELHFFVAEKGWHHGRAWYEGCFSGAGNALAAGEASPTYAMYPEFKGVAERIAGLLPEVRLVYVLRDPVQRLRSHYLHEVAAMRERRSITQALSADPRYLDTSRYAMQLDRYLACFPQGRLLVITAEQLRLDRGSTVRRVFGFLGVDPGWSPPSLGREFHRSADRRTPQPWAEAALRLPGMRSIGRLAPLRLRQLASRGPDVARAVIPDLLAAQLRSELREDVHRLRTHLGPDFDGWGIA